MKNDISFEQIFKTLLYKWKMLLMVLVMLASTIGICSGTAYGMDKSKESFTLLIYMNGSDLESRYKLATYNLSQMLSVPVSDNRFNVIIMTGGTSQWHTEGISNEEVTYLKLNGNGLEVLKALPSQSIGESETLSDFISFGTKAAPADRYGLIFWNHGAGSVRGFGVDELYDRDSLTISEIRQGLSDGLKGSKFSFIGFDACLMATVEIADACSPFADYMVASQELEPGDGWDYKVIFTELWKNPGIDTVSLCKTVIDSFIALSVEKNPYAQATLSLIDLEKVSGVSKALGSIAEKISEEVEIKNFSEVSLARNNTKAFGAPSLNNTGMDMIDITDFADQVEDMFPEQSAELKDAVAEAVAYSKTSDDVAKANGLSVYFPYKNKKQINSLESYFGSGFNEKYLTMVSGVAQRLTTGKYELSNASVNSPQDESVYMLLSSTELANIVDIYAVLIQQDDDGLSLLGLDSDILIDEKTGKINADFNRDWVSINGITTAVYTIKHDEDIIMYSVPALLNGDEVELIVVYDDDNPYGTVSGAKNISDVPDKGLIPIKDGDEIIFLYETFDMEAKTETGEKIEGASIICDGELIVDVTPVDDGKYLYGFCLLDIYQNRLYSKFISWEF